MKREVKKFVTGYNKVMDWNKEIRKDFAPTHIKEFVEEYLNTEKILEDDYDLDNAVVFHYDNDKLLEMQVYSYKTYGLSYFWLKENETKKEYKKRKIERIKQRISEEVNELTEEIDERVAERGEFLKLKEMI